MTKSAMLPALRPRFCARWRSNTRAPGPSRSRSAKKAISSATQMSDGRVGEDEEIEMGAFARRRDQFEDRLHGGKAAVGALVVDGHDDRGLRRDATGRPRGRGEAAPREPEKA